MGYADEECDICNLQHTDLKNTLSHYNAQKTSTTSNRQIKTDYQLDDFGYSITRISKVPVPNPFISYYM